MKFGDPNPYVAMHKENAIRAWRLSDDNFHIDQTKIKTNSK